MRRLALDGVLPFRTLHGWGRKASRAYLFDACRDRWGEPDADRLGMLLSIPTLQVTSAGSVIWEVMVTRPVVQDGDGEMAVTMEDEK